MDVDLDLTSSQYSLVLIVFFITYVIFEVPSNLILSKSRPSVFLPLLMILWVRLYHLPRSRQTRHNFSTFRNGLEI